MLRQKRERVEWLEFEMLANAQGLKHGIFLRPLDASGDVPETMRTILGCGNFVSGKQVHGTRIAMVPTCDPGIECDGLFTAHKGVGLMVKHADCQAAIFYDPIREIVANVHAGWRGQVQNIYAATIERMKGMGSRPQDILVGISPSLGPCCAEFIYYRQELPDHFWEFEVEPTYFDLWAIAENQLMREGILPAHIEIARLCTKCHEDDFFSYRREKETGRNATVALMVDVESDDPLQKL